MIAIDTNLLVYTHHRESRAGDAVHTFMVGLAEARSGVGDPLALLLRISERGHEPANLEGRGHWLATSGAAPGSPSRASG